MPSEISIPKALYQANIDLALRIAALLQENGKQWFDLFNEEAEVCMDERMVQADALHQDFSLERIAAMPSDALARFMGTDLERWQAVLAHVMESQSHFSSGVQAALQAWQHTCTQALGQAVGVNLPEAMSPVLPNLNDILGAFQQMMAQVLPVVGTPDMPATSTRSRPSTAPARASARKQATASSGSGKATGKRKAASEPKAASDERAAATRAAPRAPGTARKTAPKRAVRTASTPKSKSTPTPARSGGPAKRRGKRA